MSLAAMKDTHYARGTICAFQVSRSGAWLLPLIIETVHIEAPSEEVQGKIIIFLDEFVDVFDEPNDLPSFRSYNHHHIELLSGTSSVSVHPYRYAHSQKADFDRLVQEMLDTWVIRPCSSSFSSPILLVKNKDGSWYFYVDYWILNDVTVKDKHLIPMIDEMLDELYGATYFSKLDLRVGYRQIRMAEGDIDNFKK